MLTAVVHALRQAYPDARIGFIVGPDAAPMLTGNPDIDHIYVFDRKSEHRSLPARYKFFADIRDENYEVTFVMNRSFSSALYSRLITSPIRAGFATEGRSFLLTHAIPYDKQKNEYDCFYDIIDAVVPVKRHYLPQLCLNNDEMNQAYKLAEKYGYETDAPLVTVHMVTHPAKTWAADNFYEIILDILSYHDNLRVALIGGKDNIATAEYIEGKLQSQRIVNFAGRLKLRETAAIIKKSNLFIGVDSSPAHIAATFHVPSIVLFLNSSAEKWGYNLLSRIDIEGVQKDFIDVGTVKENLYSMLEKVI